MQKIIKQIEIPATTTVHLVNSSGAYTQTNDAFEGTVKHAGGTATDMMLYEFMAGYREIEALEGSTITKIEMEYSHFNASSASGSVQTLEFVSMTGIAFNELGDGVTADRPSALGATALFNEIQSAGIITTQNIQGNEKSRTTVTFSGTGAFLGITAPLGTTGKHQLVGEISSAFPESLTWDSGTDTLYTVDNRGQPSDDRLMTINQTTGLGTGVGSVTAGNEILILGSAYDRNSSVIWAADDLPSLTPRLFQINTSTGVGTLIGDFNARINSIAFDHDTDTLFGISSGTTGGLFTINTSTGAATRVSDFSDFIPGFVMGAGGLEYDEQTSSLWAINANASFPGLNRINKFTGEIVRMGDTAAAGLYNGLAINTTTNISFFIQGSALVKFNMNNWFATGIRRLNTLTSTTGEATLGGKVLAKGPGPGWETAPGTSTVEVDFPPKLIVTYETASTTGPSHEMRYTTADPTSAQNTPSNSIGGYASSNVIYSQAELGDYLTSDDAVIQISTSSSLPTSPASLVQVGPEVAKYGGVNTSSSQLTSVTRGVAPTAFPSSIDPYAETVHYLDVDKLFDTTPSDNSQQYRCVAFINTTDRDADDVSILLRQDSTAQVQVDVGIEVPKFDTGTGVQTGGGAGPVTVLTSDGFSDITGFFNGGHVVAQGGGEAIIEDYDINGSTGTFILDRSLAIADAQTFRINPAPSQTVLSDAIAPLENSGKFFGFLGAGGATAISSGGVRVNGGTLRQHDVFYLWLKRSIAENAKISSDSGAVIILQFDDTGL